MTASYSHSTPIHYDIFPPGGNMTGGNLLGNHFTSSLTLLSRVYAQLNKCLRPARMKTKGFAQLSKQIWGLSDLFSAKKTQMFCDFDFFNGSQRICAHLRLSSVLPPMPISTDWQPLLYLNALLPVSPRSIDCKSLKKCLL